MRNILEISTDINSIFFVNECQMFPVWKQLTLLLSLGFVQLFFFQLGAISVFVFYVSLIFLFMLFCPLLLFLLFNFLFLYKKYMFILHSILYIQRDKKVNHFQNYYLIHNSLSDSRQVAGLLLSCYWIWFAEIL